MTPFNDHIQLAQGMLQGHLWVSQVPASGEYVTYGGHLYTLHPPLSAILCLPFVALGIVDQQLISILIGIVSILLVYHSTRSGWLTAFFALGTTFTHEALIGASWNFCLVASVPFTLLALASDGWMCGIFAALAALARFDLVLAVPLYALIRRDWYILGGLLFWGSVYLWWNLSRFGTFSDPTLAMWYAKDTYRAIATHGTFSLYYLPYNLYTLLLMPPLASRSFPWLRPTYLGQALLSLSPALVVVKFTWWSLTAIVCSIPSLTVYANGFNQLGCRYYTQVMPLLLKSMPQGKELDIFVKILIVLSVISTTYFSLIAYYYGLAM